MTIFQKLPKIALSILNGVGVNIGLHFLLFQWLSSLGPGGTIAIIYLPVFLPIILICQIVSLIFFKLIFRSVISWFWSFVGFVSPLIVMGIYFGIASGFSYYNNVILTPDQRNNKYPLIQIKPKIYEYGDGNTVRAYRTGGDDRAKTKSDFRLTSIIGLEEYESSLYVNSDTKITIEGDQDVFRDDYVEVIEGQYWDTAGTNAFSNIIKNITFKKADVASIKDKLRQKYIDEKLSQGWTIGNLENQQVTYLDKKSEQYLVIESTQEKPYNSTLRTTEYITTLRFMGYTKTNLLIDKLIQDKSYTAKSIKYISNTSYDYPMLLEIDLE